MDASKAYGEVADHVSLITNADRRRALIGSAVGSTIEWYDYFLFGTMSAIVFGALFFPSENALTSQLLALGSFAIAFLVRPVGGVLFAHIGDRIGRKKTLFITLLMMGISTMLIGLLPTYASIGIWAPVLLTLLRLVQGLALGGEWGGGLLLAVEYSPAHRRGFYGAVPQTGTLLGLALGNLATSGMEAAVGPDAFLAYGWRLPFIASFVLVLVGLWIRTRIAETPSFRAVMAQRKTKHIPIVETLSKHWPAVLKVIGAKVVETSTFFLFATFIISHLVGMGHARSTALNVVLVAALIGVPVMLFFGSLSDRIGRKRLFIAGTIAIMVYIVPFFYLVSLGSVPIIFVAVIVGYGLIWPSYGAVLGTLFAESFPADVRYTGVSLGYQVGAALVGGPLPLIATALLVSFDGSYMPVASFIILCGAVSLIALAFTRDRTGEALDS